MFSAHEFECFNAVDAVESLCMFESFNRSIEWPRSATLIRTLCSTSCHEFITSILGCSKQDETRLSSAKNALFNAEVRSALANRELGENLLFI